MGTVEVTALATSVETRPGATITATGRWTRAGGAVRGAVAVARDVTERIEQQRAENA